MANASIEPYAIASRTDGSGGAVDDVEGETLRLVTRLISEGVVDPADAFEVTQDTGSNMNIKVGSGSAKTDLYKVDGGASGQEGYLCRLEAEATIAISAADPSNDRIDEVYLVIFDDAYDSGGEGYADIEVRTGTPASSPSAPGPDGSWDAYAKLATIEVGNGVTAITNADITDERATAGVITALLPDFAPTVVEGHSEVASVTGIGGTEEDLATVNITIPATWDGWSIHAVAHGTFYGQDTGVVQDGFLWVDLDGTESQRAKFTARGGTGPQLDPVTATGRWTGSSTGSRTIKAQAIRDGSSTLLQCLDVGLLVVAYRTA